MSFSPFAFVLENCVFKIIIIIILLIVILVVLFIIPLQTDRQHCRFFLVLFVQKTQPYIHHSSFDSFRLSNYRIKLLRNLRTGDGALASDVVVGLVGPKYH